MILHYAQHVVNSKSIVHNLLIVLPIIGLYAYHLLACCLELFTTVFYIFPFFQNCGKMHQCYINAHLLVSISQASDENT